MTSSVGNLIWSHLSENSLMGNCIYCAVTTEFGANVTCCKKDKPKVWNSLHVAVSWGGWWSQISLWIIVRVWCNDLVLLLSLCICGRVELVKQLFLVKQFIKNIWQPPELSTVNYLFKARIEAAWKIKNAVHVPQISLWTSFLYKCLWVSTY